MPSARACHEGFAPCRLLYQRQVEPSLERLAALKLIGLEQIPSTMRDALVRLFSVIASHNARMNTLFCSCLLHSHVNPASE
jgi:hypothetical protein